MSAFVDRAAVIRDRYYRCRTRGGTSDVGDHDAGATAGLNKSTTSSCVPCCEAERTADRTIGPRDRPATTISTARAPDLQQHTLGEELHCRRSLSLDLEAGRQVLCPMPLGWKPEATVRPRNVRAGVAAWSGRAVRGARRRAASRSSTATTGSSEIGR